MAKPGWPYPIGAGTQGPLGCRTKVWASEGSSPKKGRGGLEADQHAVLAERRLEFIEHCPVPSALQATPHKPGR